MAHSWHHLKYTVPDRQRERQKKKKNQKSGLVWESNPGPLAPEARIIPLDQQAMMIMAAMVMGIYQMWLTLKLL